MTCEFPHPHYLPHSNEGLISVRSNHDGYSFSLTWEKAYLDILDYQLAYNLWSGGIRPITVKAPFPEHGYQPAQAAAPTGAGQVFGGVAVDSQDLAVARGGAELDITLNEAKTRGVVSGNQASNLTTGSNYINDGSFAGAAGLLGEL